MELSELPDHARRNRAEWERWSEEFVEPGRRRWAAEEPDWGMWDVPERELNVLPDVAGKDVLELGCGTAYWSAWLARRGARVVGLDLTERQLETARQFQQEFDLEFPLIHASAEDVPLPNDTFDLVLSEYGASIWCDPERWVAEAARVLRPGGLLVFLVNGTILMLCLPDEDEELPAGDRLLRTYFGIYRFEWKSDESVDFHLGYGDWIRLLRRKGFEVENLIEVRAPEGAPPNRFNLASPEWARRWPSEEIWVARKPA
jgi:SAM-dependent methyltransferase